MDDLIPHYSSILGHFLVISECKPRERQWILVKESLLVLDAHDNSDSFLVIEGNVELYERLKYAYNAAKIGIKEGVLTGLFFGGFWGILKEVKKFNHGFSEEVKKPDEKDMKITNRSFTVVKSLEYSEQYSCTAEPISIITSLSKTTFLTETLKSYHNNVSPLDLIVRNNVKNSSEEKSDTNSVKNLFQHSELCNESNKILESLNSEVPKFYDRNPFSFKKDREKVEFVGCTLIQTGSSIDSVKFDSGSDTSGEYSNAANEKTKLHPRGNKSVTVIGKEMKQKKTSGPSIKIKEKKKVNLTIRNKVVDKNSVKTTDESYKATLLNSLPETFAADDFEELSQKDSFSLYDTKKEKSEKVKIRNSLPSNSLEKYPKTTRDLRIEPRRKKLSYLINIEELGNEYKAEEPAKQPDSATRETKEISKLSDPSLFLEEIHKLKENLLNESQYQISDDFSSENSYTETEERHPNSLSYESSERMLKNGKVPPEEGNTSETIAYSLKNGNSMQEKSPVVSYQTSSREVSEQEAKLSKMNVIRHIEPQVEPKRRKLSNTTDGSSREPEVVPAPRKKKTPDTDSKPEVIPAPRKNRISDTPSVNPEPKVIPAPRKKRLSDTSPSKPEVIPAPRKKISLDDSSPKAEPEMVQAAKKKRFSDTSTPKPEVTPAPRKKVASDAKAEPEIVPAPRKKRLSDASAAHPEPEVVPAPRKKRLLDSSTPSPEPEVVPAPRKKKSPGSSSSPVAEPAGINKNLFIIFPTQTSRPGVSPEDEEAKPVSGSFQFPESKTAPALTRTIPSVNPVSRTSAPDKKPQEAAVPCTAGPSKYRRASLSSANDNFIFTNACNCAIVLGIICCGLSALKASFSALQY